MPALEVVTGVGVAAVRLSIALAVMSAPGLTFARPMAVPALSTLAEAASVKLGNAGVLRFYTARLPSGELPDRREVKSALVVVHGYPRDTYISPTAFPVFCLLPRKRGAPIPLLYLHA